MAEETKAEDTGKYSQAMERYTKEEWDEQMKGKVPANLPPLPVKVAEESDGVMVQWEKAGTNIVTNITVDTPAGRAMSTRCLAQADKKTRNVVGSTIEVTHILAHEAEMMDKETGEITKKVRVAMVLVDGTIVSTTSKACVRMLSMLYQACGGKPFDPPILIEVREFPLEDGKSYCDMREVVRIDPPTTKKK